MYIDPDGLILLSSFSFESEIQAVRHAVDKAHSDRRSWFNEFGGIVYQKCTKFAYDYKFIEGRTGHISPSKSVIDSGAIAVSGWHTHPRWMRYDGIYFSPQDKSWVQANKMSLWLGTPGGNLKILRYK
jgi:hypothetical protein